MAHDQCSLIVRATEGRLNGRISEILTLKRSLNLLLRTLAWERIGRVEEVIELHEDCCLSMWILSWVVVSIISIT